MNIGTEISPGSSGPPPAGGNGMETSHISPERLRFPRP
jgi:hypothetical protein